MTVIQYSEIRARVEAGQIVGVVPTRTADGKPSVFVAGAPLDARGRRLAYALDPEIRAGQALGYVDVLRSYARERGLNPA